MVGRSGTFRCEGSKRHIGAIDRLPTSRTARPPQRDVAERVCRCSQSKPGAQIWLSLFFPLSSILKICPVRGTSSGIRHRKAFAGSVQHHHIFINASQKCTDSISLHWLKREEFYVLYQCYLRKYSSQMVIYIFFQNTVLIWGWVYVGTGPKFFKGHLNRFRYGAFTACLSLTGLLLLNFAS